MRKFVHRHLLDIDDCEIMADDFRLYADELCAMLREAAVICEGLEQEENL